jgi:hypothetical protein
MYTKITAIIFLSILLGLSGCAKEKAKPVSIEPLKEKEMGTVKKLEEQKQVRYTYAGEKYRDPFAPLEEMGKAVGKMGKRAISIDISTLKLTGIMISPSTRERYAVIEAGEGRGYIVKGGKLVDNYNNTVKDVRAIVRKDKVILITSDNVIRELELKTK